MCGVCLLCARCAVRRWCLFVACRLLCGVWCRLCVVCCCALLVVSSMMIVMCCLLLVCWLESFLIGGCLLFGVGWFYDVCWCGLIVGCCLYVNYRRLLAVVRCSLLVVGWLLPRVVAVCC